MFIELTQSQKVIIHNKFKNSGFEITEIDLTTAEFLESDNNKSISCILDLPDKTKRYTDYSAMLLWTNDESGYSSMPLPIAYTSLMGEGETAKFIDTRIAVQDIEPGKIKITFSVYDDNYDYTFFDDIIYSLESLALYSAPYLNINAENTIIAGAATTLYDAYFASAENALESESILKGKRNVLTCDYDNEESNGLIKYYTVSWREPTGTDVTPVFDGTNYYAPASNINLTYIPFIKIEGLNGYTLDDYDVLDEQAKLIASSNNTQKLNEEISKLSTKLRYIFLEKDLIYPIGNTANECIVLGSRIVVVGNNSTLKVEKSTDSVVSVFCNNKIVSNPNTSYGNIYFYNLNVAGRYTGTTKPADQAIHCYNIQKNESFSRLPQNVNFENCKFTNFCYGVHINNNKYYDVSLYWTFTNCEFLHTATGFMLTGVSSLKLLNSHIDNSMSQVKGQHCIYVSEKCSYITVDRCLLENSAGGAIHQLFGHPITTSEYNHDNRYTNLTIRSCLTAFNIGASSKNTTIENIHMYNIVRGIKLHSCINTVIKNVYGTGSFYSRPRNYANGAERIFDGRGNIDKPVIKDIEWLLINIRGKVSATISDCYFKFSSTTFSTAKYDNTDKGSENLTELEALYKYHHTDEDNWFADDVIESDVKFVNCVFDTTFNNIAEPSCNSYLGYTETVDLIRYNLSIKYKNNIKFIECQFLMNYDTVKNAFFYFKGNVNCPSQYLIDSCKIFIFIEDTASQSNIPSVTYFSATGQGSEVTIKDCDFYKTNGDNDELCSFYIDVDGHTTFINNHFYDL